MFDWDEDNIGHIAEHDVTTEEAEQVVRNDPVDGGVQDHDAEERFVEIGVTDAMRVLVVVSTFRGELIRVVPAYPATPADREFYGNEKRGRSWKRKN